MVVTLYVMSKRKATRRRGSDGQAKILNRQKEDNLDILLRYVAILLHGNSVHLYFWLHQVVNICSNV